MAKYIEVDNRLDVLQLSKQEAAQVIALLVAQLADTTISGMQAGACPEVVIHDGLFKRLAFCIDRKTP